MTNFTKNLKGAQDAHGTNSAPKTRLRAPQSRKIESPLHSIEAEQATLGAMIRDSSIIETALALIEPNDFYFSSNRHICEAIVGLHKRGETIDFVTVVDDLQRHDLLHQVGEAAYITAIIEASDGSANVTTHARIVRERSRKRLALQQIEKAGDFARNGVPADVALDELEKSIQTLRDKAPSKVSTFSATDLWGMDLPEPKYAVNGIIAQGLGFLAGPPKIGKSWLIFSTCIAVASGGKALSAIDVECGDVLYLALEDNKRRLQDRMKKLLPKGAKPPERLTMAIEWPRMGQGGIEAIAQWLEKHPQARLVVIDTFQKIRPPRKRNAGIYEEDYDVAGAIKSLADKYGVAILVVHHLKKGEVDDPLEAISGSTGLTGAPDSLLILRRDRSRADASLFVTGRDINEQDLALEWKAEFGLWSLMGDAGEYRLSQERAAVIQALKASSEPLSPKAIYDSGVGKSRESVRFMLRKMVEAGQVVSSGSGLYSLPVTTNSTNSANNTNTANTTNSKAIKEDSDVLLVPVCAVSAVSAVSGVSEKESEVIGYGHD